MAPTIRRKPLPSRICTEPRASSTPSSVNSQSASLIQFEDYELDLGLFTNSHPAAEHQSLLFASDSVPSTAIPQYPGHSHSAHISAKSLKGADSSNSVIELGAPPIQYVSWGVDWRKPTFICVALVCALSLSLGHHFYYSSLNSKIAGDEAKQAWTIRFGTGFAFLIVLSLHAATAVAFGQYVWTVVKRTPLTLESLDTLYSLTSDPSGIFSFELFSSAKVALLFALTFWSVGLVGITPPATLTVIARNITYYDVPVPILDLSQTGWERVQEVWNPGWITYTIATQAAIGLEVVALPPPVASQDWAYEIEFLGPTTRCELASPEEQAVFDNVSLSFESNNLIFNYLQLNDAIWNNTINWQGPMGTPIRLFYSSWAYSDLNSFGVGPTDWFPDCAGCRDSSYSSNQAIYIQTSTASIVCYESNALFTITIQSVGGQQQITQTDIRPAPNTTSSSPANSAHYLALSALLMGNLTLSYLFIMDPGPTASYKDQWMINSGDTQMLSTGLIACNDIQASPWVNLSNKGDGSPDTWPNYGALVSWRQMFQNTFPSEPWMCRNQTFLRAIEDLANNITISYLSSPELTNTNTTFKTITTSNSSNYYQYRPLYLALPYGIGLLCVSIVATIGLYSIHLNGVTHSMNFSSILATTRNPDLDVLTRGASLGAEPLKTDISKVKLRFGPLLDSKEGERGDDDEGIHVGFGRANKVGTLRKGKSYI
ncbi:uncharacterized protein LY89DRAFT_594462 [Mollisia scopiformis]|uniref:Uncharacterized protein n=1 Tax=Mollisia scopiformis TaxID=149040 RepID=A0A194WUL1_MOLSC|nr:uncharacterized protein LY89DRAFT_594462 [Mollisia scopiformis]KUJ11656.1 hypothetical protein LY89DRAFT_594462 [Mollisia scopiformis]